jgi:hypothetical protein
MKIGDYKQMMAYLTRPEQPKEQVADLVDDLTPGPLKDELTKGLRSITRILRRIFTTKSFR